MKAPAGLPLQGDSYYAGLPEVSANELVDRFIKRYELADSDQSKLAAYDKLIAAANVNRADIWWKLARDDADSKA